jgi:hypothetical protein
LKYQIATHLSDLSHYQCAGKLGWFLDKLQGRWYMVSWLLDEIMEPTAIPSHPQQHRGGGDSRRVDGTLAHSSNGDKTISELGKSPVAGSTSSLPPTMEHGGEPRRVDGTLAR